MTHSGEPTPQGPTHRPPIQIDFDSLTALLSSRDPVVREAAIQLSASRARQSGWSLKHAQGKNGQPLARPTSYLHSSAMFAPIDDISRSRAMKSASQTAPASRAARQTRSAGRSADAEDDA